MSNSAITNISQVQKFLCIIFPLLLLAGIDCGLNILFPYRGEMGFLQKLTGTPALYFIERGKTKLHHHLSPAKPAGVKRIFTFGGSSTWGIPYGAPGSFSGWLAEIFAVLAPNQQIEVINTGYPSEPLATVRDFVQAALAYQPDIFVIYSGHNEFLFQNQILRQRAVEKRLIHEIRRWLCRESFLFYHLSRWYKSRFVAKDYYPLEQVRVDLYDTLVDEYFQKELREILELGRKHKIKIIVATVASNLKDYEPLGSEWQELAQSDAEQRVIAAELLQQMRQAIFHDNLPRAERAYQHLSLISPGYAQASFELGSYYYQKQEFTRAKQLLFHAKEEDIVAVRSKGRFNALIRREVRRQKFRDDPNISLLDLEAKFEENSPGGIPGSKLLIDGMHPTLEGHFLIATQLAQIITERHWLSTAASFSSLPAFEVFRANNKRLNEDAILESAQFFQADLKRARRAEELYRDFLKISNHWAAHLGLAVIALDQGNRIEAAAEIRVACSLLPTTDQPIRNLLQRLGPQWSEVVEQLIVEGKQS